MRLPRSHELYIARDDCKQTHPVARKYTADASDEEVWKIIYRALLGAATCSISGSGSRLLPRFRTSFEIE